MSSIADEYLVSMLKRFENIKELGDGALAQLDDDDIRFTPDPEVNSVGVTIQHMHGNMLSRWTDFLTTDGDKETRDRDGEFEDKHYTKEKVLALWGEGWACTFGALRALGPADLTKTVEIRGMPLSALDAINRQIAHYGYHVGQIVLLAKIRKGAHWKTLSIARGASGKYIPRARD